MTSTLIDLFTPFAARMPRPDRVSPPQTRVVVLERDALLSVTQPQGQRVECVSGALWLTFDDDPHDTTLGAGESHVVSGRTRMLLQALQPSVLVIHGPRGAAINAAL